jgi:hypothetical protein
MNELANEITWSVLAPVVLDLDGDGIEYVSFATSTINFDMDGDGDLDRTSWVGADDAILVYDRNGNGLADDGTEISFQSLVSGAASDLEGLAFFDSNNDGYLDAGDAEFGKFRIWRDVNQNGITDAGEFNTFADLGIQWIELQGDRTGTLPNGREPVTFATATYLKTDQTLGVVADSFFVFEPTIIVPTDPNNPPTPGGETSPTFPAPPALAIASHSFDRKAKKYRIEARDGSLFVNLKKQSGSVDARANSVGPAIILNFKNVGVGLLSPVILDLDGDGIDLKSRKKSQARFDMDGDGTLDDTGWVGKGDGILVIDRNNDGLITSASELSFLTERPNATSDLNALGALDSNRDGFISSADARFGELKVWIDSNDNGVTDQGELKTLTELGISEISLAARNNSATVKPGQNIIIATSTFKRTDGTTGTLGDVALAFDPSSTRPRAAVATTEPPITSLGEAQLDGIRTALGRQGISEQSVSTQWSFALDPDASKIALMAQAMATFGVIAGSEMNQLQPTENSAVTTFYAGT